MDNKTTQMYSWLHVQTSVVEMRQSINILTQTDIWLFTSVDGYTEWDVSAEIFEYQVWMLKVRGDKTNIDIFSVIAML